MGLLNLEQHVKRIEKFKDSKCPICDNAIEIDSNYNIKADCIDYKCKNCSPGGCIISISGSVIASSSYTKIITDKIVKQYVLRKINACETGIVNIMSSDFRYL